MELAFYSFDLFLSFALNIIYTYVRANELLQFQKKKYRKICKLKLKIEKLSNNAQDEKNKEDETHKRVTHFLIRITQPSHLNVNHVRIFQ